MVPGWHLHFPAVTSQVPCPRAITFWTVKTVKRRGTLAAFLSWMHNAHSVVVTDQIASLKRKYISFRYPNVCICLLWHKVSDPNVLKEKRQTLPAKDIFGLLDLLLHKEDQTIFTCTSYQNYMGNEGSAHCVVDHMVKPFEPVTIVTDFIHPNLF